MNSVDALTGILGIALVSGVNLYLAILTLGVGMRWGWITGLPPELQVLQNPVVLIAAGVFYAAEFIADKVPFFTPIWDAVHTVIRPLGAAMLAFGAAGEMHPLAQMAAVLFAGSVALGTHSSKMGLRLLAHTVPEPVTHSAISVAEDIGVIGLLLLAYQYPHIALPVLLVLLGLMAWLTPLLLRILRFGVSSVIGGLSAFSGPATQTEVHDWARRGSAGGHMTQVFGRKGPFPKLCLAYLTEDGVTYRRWLSPRFRKLPGLDQAKLEKGLFADVLTVPGGPSFYLSKDWSKAWERQTGTAVEATPIQNPAEMS